MTVKAQRVHFPSEQMPYRWRQDSLQQKNAMQISAIKKPHLNARKEDIVIVKSPVGMPGRAILNPFMKKVKELGRIAPAHCFQCLKHCNPGTTPYCITQALINAAKGKIDDALLFCGAYAYQATHLETVKEVIDSLIPERV